MAASSLSMGAQEFASRNLQETSTEILDLIEEREARGLGIVALSTAGGVVVGQEITDRVLPTLNRPIEPESASDFAVSGGVKTATGVGLGLIALRMSGLPMVGLAWGAVGSLAGAGADFLNAFQRTGFFAESPYGQGQVAEYAPAGGGGSGNRRAQSPRTSAGTRRYR